MCGLVGILTGGDPTNLTCISAMTDKIVSRGPDDQGHWVDETAGIALGHRRLSIVDLSSAGHQPMRSESGRFVISFNGEIYNHMTLRDELEKSQQVSTWHGHSDTETLLAAIETWGLEQTLRRSTGMFAIALWDRQERVLSLARDRLGEKPLYCGWQQGTFLFGSELKALKPHPAFIGDIDRGAMTLQLRHNYIPAPFSIYKGIGKLPPGTILRLDASAIVRKDDIETATPYWSLTDAVAHGQADPYTGTDAEAIEALDQLLRNTIAQQMMADVPLGAFLSGGIDSSTVVSLMQAQSSRPVKTFSIGFNEAGYNEAVYAKEVAQHLRTEHTELYVSPQQAMDVIPRLPTLYDEPFSDSSQIPTFLVSEMTRQHVTVSLSGDAGDELFGGYNRYLLANNLWGKVSRVPPWVRAWGTSMLTALPPDQWNKLLGPFQRLMPIKWRLSNLGDKIHKGAGVLRNSSLEMLYNDLISHWTNPSSLVIGGNEPNTLISDPDPFFSSLGGIERMMALDTLTYLPDDILCKVDRAAMGVSLETRVPFLDHRLVDFAWRLPMNMKIRDGQGKWILRQVLYKYVPKELIERPKMGFGVPIDSWLRGPLRDWAESLLDESRLRQEGFFNPAPIRQKWMEHLSGKRNWQYHLWDVLMFQAWLEKERVS
jgi:asparagine synthase (glutamine-hydrolysing)